VLHWICHRTPSTYGLRNDLSDLAQVRRKAQRPASLQQLICKDLTSRNCFIVGRRHGKYREGRVARQARKLNDSWSSNIAMKATTVLPARRHTHVVPSPLWSSTLKVLLITSKVNNHSRCETKAGCGDVSRSLGSRGANYTPIVGQIVCVSVGG
jgi:hypothetical protein